MSEEPRLAAPIGSASRFERLIERARLVLVWERLWPALWPPLGLAALFAAISWLGLWLILPPVARVVGCALVALALLASLVPLVRLARPGRREALNRLDRDATLGHRPATTLDDTLALGTEDPATRALWEAHRRRAEAGVSALRVAAPRPGMAGRDRFALRAGAIVAFVASAFVAGPELGPRLLSAFDWQGAEPQGASIRIDGWVDPPLYTRLPPIVLDLAQAGTGPTRVRAPVKSILVIRAAGTSDIEISADAGLAAQPAKAPARPGLTENRFVVEGNAALAVSAGGAEASLVVEAIPDLAPEIAFAGPPQVNVRGSVTLAYRAMDDYGLVSAEGVVEKADGPAQRSLVPAPRIALSLPADRTGEDETKTTADLSAHPWAGARVRLTLVARDEAGNEGKSETLALTLPQRPFTKPLAKALVEQRRNLIVEPDRRARVQTALDALLIAPDRYTPQTGAYLGLRIIAQRLRSARGDADLIDVAEFLWQMALHIEDGDLSEAERELRAAQEALRQALDRNAGEEEIKKLTQDLRAALDRFLNEFAQRQQNRDQAQNERSDPNARTITPNDLKNLLDRMEDLAKQGATADAQRLLEELRNILENLQTARPGQQGDPMQREMSRALNELDQMIREQQDLRDDTYRDGQGREEKRTGRNREQRRGEAGREGERQRGERQRGQRQQGQRQQGQQGQQGEGEEQAEGQEGQEGAQGQGQQGLSRRQQALREKLDEMKRRMRGMGMQGEPGLDEAEGAMREAEGSLGQGQSGEAVDAQGRALDAMRRGAQGMAQQMMGDGDGTEQAGEQDGQPGRPGGRAQGGQRDTDPLGRPTRGRDWTDGRVRIPTGSESAVARARRILDELRRRLGDPLRPREELDYIERLLRPR